MGHMSIEEIKNAMKNKGILEIRDAAEECGIFSIMGYKYGSRSK